ncbi:MAG: beta-glucosidase, partial [Muribaculaceae bacterium]|nr:beta-glucosidase [Muribaculaceae bacterium]
MKHKKLSVFLAACLFAASAWAASDAKMNLFIDNLMSKMTLQEKIGQLNLPVTGDIVTGTAKSSDIAGKIKLGQVGGLFNLKGVEAIREI